MCCWGGEKVETVLLFFCPRISGASGRSRGAWRAPLTRPPTLAATRSLPHGHMEEHHHPRREGNRHAAPRGAFGGGQREVGLARPGVAGGACKSPFGGARRHPPTAGCERRSVGGGARGSHHARPAPWTRLYPRRYAGVGRSSSLLATPRTGRQPVRAVVAEQRPNRGDFVPMPFGARRWIS